MARAEASGSEAGSSLARWLLVDIHYGGLLHLGGDPFNFGEVCTLIGWCPGHTILDESCQAVMFALGVAGKGEAGEF